MLKTPPVWAQAAFGSSVQDLARAGQPPHVLLDCLRFLAARGLTAPSLFNSAVNKRQLLALKEAYDAGRRALRSAKVAANLDPSAAANLLLLWLGALPEPLFPAEHVPELLTAHAQSGVLPRAQSVALMRALLKRTEPFIVEALFPLFELLHHYWINQADREACLGELAATFAAPVFGTPAEHGAAPEAAATLEAAAALLIMEYRPLFTQPYNLQRYAADLARQAAEAEAKASRSSAVVASVPVPMQAAAGKASPHYYHPALDTILTDVAGSPKLEVGSPLLTPRRMGALSVMCPTIREELFGTSPDDGLGSPLLGSPHACDGGAADDVEAMVEGLLESTVAAAFVGQHNNNNNNNKHSHHHAGKDGASGGVSVLDHCNVSRETSDSDAEMPSYEAIAAMLS